MKEADVQQWVRNQLLAYYDGKIYIFKVPQGQYTSRRGIPDLVCSIHGLFVAIEVKTETGKLTKLQAHEINKINSAEGMAFVIYGKDKDGLITIINAIDRAISFFDKEDR